MGSGNNIPATIDEVYETVLKLSKDTEISMSEFDSLVWNFCSSGYGKYVPQILDVKYVL